MKIKYVTTEGFDVVNGNTHLNYALMSEILKRGHQLQLVQSFRNGKEKNIPDEFAAHPNFSCEVVDRPVCNKSNFIKRALNEFSYYNKVAALVNRGEKADIVFYQASGLTFYLIHKIRKCGMPIVLNLQDVFPDTLKTTGVCTNKFILSVFYRLQKTMFKRLSHVTVLSEDMKNNIVNRYHLNPQDITVIYNWFDEDKVREIAPDENKFVRKYNLKKEKFIIQYAGNLGYVLDYDAFIDLGKKLRKYPQFLIQIVGNGSCEHILKSRVEEEKLENFEFIDFQPLELVPDVYSYCDVCYIPLKPGVIYHSVPSKASIVTACRRPVLMVFDEGTSYGNIFREAHCGYVCCREKLHDAVDYLLKLAESPEFMEDQKNRSYKLAYDRLSKAENCGKEIDLFEKIAAK